ncbi:MAG TPA: TIGR03086 family metal-binding protein [Ilumatobacteraceae bacterium]|nr:TIGR03086 family metal-binding protein [Ilumatobacteraceae bacterium]
MSANLRLYTSTVYAFEHVLKMAKPTAFSRKAPCAGWTGKDVYEHVAGNLAMIKSYATSGKGPKSTPKLGADPLGAWIKLRDQTLEALDHDHVLESVAHDPFGPGFGPMTIDALVGFMAADMVPHIWDMARTAKVDERLDPALVKYSLATWKALPADVLRMPGMMGAAVKAPAGADAQTKMLSFLGRTV